MIPDNSGMGISAAELNRATLARQLLLEREKVGVTDAVRRVVALQAQQPASPYLALWNRLTGFDPAELDAAFADHLVVKSTLMRITLHAVHAEDYPAFRAAMEPTIRASRLGDPRFTRSGLTAGDADALLPELLTYASQPRTSAELAAWLEERAGGPIDPAAWRMLRQYAPLLHEPIGGPWSFGTRQSFIAARERPVLTDPDIAADKLRALLLRYLTAFGPASVADMARFALVSRARAKAAAALSSELDRLEGPRGEVMYDVPGAPRPDGATPAPPRLMAMWDSVLLAYADGGRVVPPAYRSYVTRINGDVLPTVLADGYVAGVWRLADGGIEVSAFHPLPAGTWDGLAAEAAELVTFLASRDSRAYSLYDHWWDKGLPAAEVRLLPGR